MKGAPKSKVFDDVYFSVEDGLAETQHVFLDGNGLPAIWGNADEFVVFETGFGTGLNFLATWELFEKTAKVGQVLHFISVEKYPLDSHDIRQALEIWGFADMLDVMLDHYPRSFKTDTVRLTLLEGDVNEVMPSLNYQVDCWFLDGFKPSANPEMWSDIVFENMARMSKKDARFATFTAAGFVRRGLQTVGFEVSKVPGFGKKREMLVGHKL